MFNGRESDISYNNDEQIREETRQALELIRTTLHGREVNEVVERYFEDYCTPVARIIFGDQNCEPGTIRDLCISVLNDAVTAHEEFEHKRRRVQLPNFLQHYSGATGNNVKFYVKGPIPIVSDIPYVKIIDKRRIDTFKRKTLFTFLTWATKYLGLTKVRVSLLSREPNMFRYVMDAEDLRYLRDRYPTIPDLPPVGVHIVLLDDVNVLLRSGQYLRNSREELDAFLVSHTTILKINKQITRSFIPEDTPIMQESQISSTIEVPDARTIQVYSEPCVQEPHDVEPNSETNHAVAQSQIDQNQSGTITHSIFIDTPSSIILQGIEASSTPVNNEDCRNILGKSNAVGAILKTETATNDNINCANSIAESLKEKLRLVKGDQCKGNKYPVIISDEKGNLHIADPISNGLCGHQAFDQNANESNKMGKTAQHNSTIVNKQNTDSASITVIRERCDDRAKPTPNSAVNRDIFNVSPGVEKSIKFIKIDKDAKSENKLTTSLENRERDESFNSSDKTLCSTIFASTIPMTIENQTKQISELETDKKYAISSFLGKADNENLSQKNPPLCRTVPVIRYAERPKSSVVKEQASVTVDYFSQKRIIFCPTDNETSDKGTSENGSKLQTKPLTPSSSSNSSAIHYELTDQDRELAKQDISKVNGFKEMVGENHEVLQDEEGLSGIYSNTLTMVEHDRDGKTTEGVNYPVCSSNVLRDNPVCGLLSNEIRECNFINGVNGDSNRDNKTVINYQEDNVHESNNDDGDNNEEYTHDGGSINVNDLCENPSEDNSRVSHDRCCNTENHAVENNYNGNTLNNIPSADGFINNTIYQMLTEDSTISYGESRVDNGAVETKFVKSANSYLGDGNHTIMTNCDEGSESTVTNDEECDGFSDDIQSTELVDVDMSCLNINSQSSNDLGSTVRYVENEYDNSVTEAIDMDCNVKMDDYRLTNSTNVHYEIEGDVFYEDDIEMSETTMDYEGLEGGNMSSINSDFAYTDKSEFHLPSICHETKESTPDTINTEINDSNQIMQYVEDNSSFEGTEYSCVSHEDEKMEYDQCDETRKQVSNYTDSANSISTIVYANSAGTICTPTINNKFKECNLNNFNDTYCSSNLTDSYNQMNFLTAPMTEKNLIDITDNVVDIRDSTFKPFQVRNVEETAELNKELDDDDVVFITTEECNKCLLKDSRKRLNSHCDNINIRNENVNNPGCTNGSFSKCEMDNVSTYCINSSPISESKEAIDLLTEEKNPSDLSNVVLDNTKTINLNDPLNYVNNSQYIDRGLSNVTSFAGSNYKCNPHKVHMEGRAIENIEEVKKRKKEWEPSTDLNKSYLLLTTADPKITYFNKPESEPIVGEQNSQLKNLLKSGNLINTHKKQKVSSRHKDSIAGNMIEVNFQKYKNNEKRTPKTSCTVLSSTHVIDPSKTIVSPNFFNAESTIQKDKIPVIESSNMDIISKNGNAVNTAYNGDKITDEKIYVSVINRNEKFSNSNKVGSAAMTDSNNQSSKHKNIKANQPKHSLRKNKSRNNEQIFKVPLPVPKMPITHTYLTMSLSNKKMVTIVDAPKQRRPCLKTKVSTIPDKSFPKKTDHRLSHVFETNNIYNKTSAENKMDAVDVSTENNSNLIALLSTPVKKIS